MTVTLTGDGHCWRRQKKVKKTLTTMASANLPNEVDYLLTHPFSLMSLEEKKEIKRLGAHRPNDVQIKQKDTR